MEDYKIRERTLQALKEKQMNAVRQRESFAIRIRKKKRELLYEKMRAEAKNELGEALAPSPALIEYSPVFANPSTSLREQIIIISEIMGNTIESEELLFGLVEFLRFYITSESCSQIELILKIGLVEKILLLVDSPSERVQFEALWALMNIAGGSSEHSAYLKKYDAVPKLLHVLPSLSKRCKYYCIWTLVNLVVDSTDSKSSSKEEILKNDLVLDELLEIFKLETEDIGVLQHACWALASLFRGESVIKFDRISSFLPYIEGLLHFDDEEIMREVLWILSFVTDCNEGVKKHI